MSEGELKQYIEKLNGSEGVCRISCINAADVRLVLRRGKCAVIIEFIHNKNHERLVIRGDLETITQEEIDKHIAELEEELTALQSINAVISKPSGKAIRVMLRWSDGEVCDVSDWDYESVEIRLSRECCAKVPVYYKHAEFIREESLVRLLKDFDSYNFCRQIGARLTGRDIYTELSQNMLTVSDIEELVVKDKVGKKYLKSVVSLRDLGYIGIFNWVIDYGKREVEVTVKGDKLLSVADGTLYSDSALCKSLCKTMQGRVKERLLWV